MINLNDVNTKKNFIYLKFWICSNFSNLFFFQFFKLKKSTKKNENKKELKNLMLL